MEYLNIEDFARKRVIEYMQTKGMTCYQLSGYMDMPKTTVGCYLSGKAKPSLYFIQQFCKLFAISQSTFYEPYDKQEQTSLQPQFVFASPCRHSKFSRRPVFKV